LKDISNQMEENLFKAGFDIPIPAIKTVKNNKIFYTFQIVAEEMLKLSYVFRLETNNLVNSYQRLLSKKKINKIRTFLDKEGFFANNILVGTEKELDFKLNKGEKNKTIMTGTLLLPNLPCYLEIIDGQHRLLAYSGEDDHISDCLCVTIISNISEIDRAKVFVDVNKEQTKVSGALLWKLYQRTEPTSERAKISFFVENLNDSEIFYDKIEIPSIHSSSSHLSFTQICNWLFRTKLYQNYGKRNKFSLVFQSFWDEISNDSNLKLDWGQSNTNKGKKGFLCSNTGISTLICLMNLILDERIKNIPYPSNKKNRTKWRTFLRTNVNPKIFEYLESQKSSDINDPYGHLRSKTNVGERTEMARSIFSLIKF